MASKLPEFLLDDYKIENGTVKPTHDPMNVADWAAHTEQHRPSPRPLPVGERFMRSRGFRKASDPSAQEQYVNQLKELYRRAR